MSVVFQCTSVVFRLRHFCAVYLLVLTVVVGCQSVLFRRDLHPAVLAMGVDY